MSKQLGKIASIKLGFGGYQNNMLGLSVTLEGQNWGVGDFKGWWAMWCEIDKYTKWTEEDRRNSFADVMIFIDKLLTQAKKTSIDELKGVPVEVEINDFSNTLESWRILEEVI